MGILSLIDTFLSRMWNIFRTKPANTPFSTNQDDSKLKNPNKPLSQDTTSSIASEQTSKITRKVTTTNDQNKHAASLIANAYIVHGPDFARVLEGKNVFDNGPVNIELLASLKKQRQEKIKSMSESDLEALKENMRLPKIKSQLVEYFNKQYISLTSPKNDTDRMVAKMYEEHVNLEIEAFTESLRFTMEESQHAAKMLATAY